MRAVIRDGMGRMPGLPDLRRDAASVLLAYVLTGENKTPGSQSTMSRLYDGMALFIDYLRRGPDRAADGSAWPVQRFRSTGYKKVLTPDGYPAITPPWGTLNAINLDTGEYAWKVPLGEYPELAALGLIHTGSENYGGPIVTAGGLVFIGATSFDKKLHVFDKSSGQLLWETTLPFPGNATPITYQINGRQYLAIATGGGKNAGSTSRGVYVAFALPIEGQSRRR